MENTINMLGCGWCIYLLGVIVTLFLMGYFKAKIESFNAMLWPLYALVVVILGLYSAPIVLGRYIRNLKSNKNEGIT